MIYTEYDKLTIIKLMNEADSLSFDELGAILKERPANVIYCELSGKLYGIISMGDVARASDDGKKAVNINRKFTSVKPNEYMKARQIFKEKEKINAVPVIDENGGLLGDYTRWDDLLVLEYLNLFDENTYIDDFLKGEREENNYIALVKPNGVFDEKVSLMGKWKSKFNQLGARVKVIDRMSVPECIDKVNLVLFTDEDELRGSFALITKIYRKELIKDKWYTYKGFWEKARKQIEDKTLDKCLEYIRKKGVHILAIQFRDNGSEYYQNVCKDISQKFINEDVLPSNLLPSSAMEDFFEEVYTEEYAKAIAQVPFKIENFNGSNRVKDMSGKYHNVEGGERLTVESPLEFDRTIYFFGPCVILGSYVEDKHTIESFLQVKCNSAGNRCRVVNLGCCDNPADTIKRILSTPIKENDIIVIYLANREISCTDNLNLTDALEKNDAPAKWFVNSLWHCNYKVNEICADAIYEMIRPVLEIPNCSGSLIDMVSQNMAVFDTYFNCYFNDFNPDLYGRIGSIVMNCNPFTNGHRFLIEESLKYVDYLIIFVVEENQSDFTFDERFALVNMGVSDLQNVMVVPSGQFILSQKTFPEYFLKVEDEDIIKNVEYDITLFAEHIAPRLNITYRFVGQEPQDAVTNEYNKAMKRILPQKGINIIEIPRKENDDGVISASLVRKYLEDDNCTDLKELIPKSTWEILFG